MANKQWYQSKAIWTGVVAVVGAAAGAMTGEITIIEAAQIVVAALFGIFMRMGVGSSIAHKEE